MIEMYRLPEILMFPIHEILFYPLPGISISDVKQDWYKTKYESIDDTGEWFIVPVSIRSLRSTVILRLHGPADVGSVKDIQALPLKLKTR